ncbi:MAG: hypothetical protein ACT4P9_08455 [Betaproteobacteria bacterium]
MIRVLFAVLSGGLLAAGAIASPAADPASDAPESRPAVAAGLKLPASYTEALAAWRSVEDVNAWIGARFEYDMNRAARLSETQRAQKGRVEIHKPEAFFAAPSGICVDLARFGVETLRAVAPETKPRYLMIEFDPVVIKGNTLRRHWVTQVERGGQFHFFADSKRPGHVAGPYASVEAYIEAYSRYRGRPIVAHRSLDSYERRLKARAEKTVHSEAAQ